MGRGEQTGTKDQFEFQERKYVVQYITNVDCVCEEFIVITSII